MSYAFIFLQHQQTTRLMVHVENFHTNVIMGSVFDIAASVMVSMTVETALMKLDVMVQVVQVCTLYIYNVKCILTGEWISQCLSDIMWCKATTLISASFLRLSIDFELLSVKYSKIVAVVITYPHH